jgi:hypothetical protein
MNKMNWKWTLVCAAALIAATMLLDARAWAGKPGGGGGTTPPIRYQINYFTAPQSGLFGAIRAMNNAGAMVGEYYKPYTTIHHGFIYDPAMSFQQAFDLNDLVQVPKDWQIRYAYGINDKGAITAAIVKTSAATPNLPGFEIHGIYIDRCEAMVDGRWVPHFLPGVNPAFSFGRDINNNGDIVGVFDQGLFYQTNQLGAFVYNTGLYRESGPDLAPTILPVDVGWPTVHLNDPVPGRSLQIAGLTSDNTPFRYTLGDEYPATFPELCSPPGMQAPSVGAINGYGEFCGRIRVPKQKGSQFVYRPFRFNPNSQVSPTLLGSESEHSGLIGWDINNTSDVAAYGFGNQYLFHNAAGALNLGDLVTGTSDQLSTWLGTRWGIIHLTERVAVQGVTTHFPWIGTSGDSSVFGCLLIPVSPTPVP